MFPRVNVLGAGISAITMQDALRYLAECVEQRIPTYVVVSTVYTVMQCQRSPEMRETVNRAGLVTPDGMPLVFIAHWKGHPRVSRVYGPDLMLAFSALAAKRDYTNFYYGGAEGVPEALAARLTADYPALRVVGAYSPPFRPLNAAEDEQIIDMINAANPDIVWVGLGCPKQDLWMARHREQLNAPVLIGVGAAFDFHTGRVRQAPAWMQRHALEWLFRLWVEPRRLWRRYLIYNPLFILLFLAQTLRLKRYSI